MEDVELFGVAAELRRIGLAPESLRKGEVRDYALRDRRVRDLSPAFVDHDPAAAEHRDRNPVQCRRVRLAAMVRTLCEAAKYRLHPRREPISVAPARLKARVSAGSSGSLRITRAPSVDAGASSRAVSKTRQGRWVNVPPVLFAAVAALCPRDDRHPERRVFENVTADRLRTAIGRACTAAGVPLFSPRDLRHRRISLWHLAGVPWVTIGQHVGQRDLAVTSNTYSHVLADEAELDYEAALRPVS